MEISIVGGGAVGLLLAYSLSIQGHTTTLHVRTEVQEKEINAHGISYRNGSVRIVKAKVFDGHFEHSDLIILAIKQNEIEKVYRKIKTVHYNIPFLLIQNGIGHIRKLLEIAKAPLYTGIVTHGAIRRSNIQVEHTGIGKVTIGSMTESKERIYSMLHPDPPFQIEWSENIDKIQRQKLLTNAIINPLTMINQVKNGQLLENEKLYETLKQLYNEISRILELKDQWDFLRNLIKLTANNESSMLIDYKMKRKSEIDSIVGEILLEAKNKNLDSPLSEELYNKVKQIERNYEAC